MTGEETVLSPRELNDEESTGELPEKEPVRQDNETYGTLGIGTVQELQEVRI